MKLLYRVQTRLDHGWAASRMSAYLDGELAPPERTRMERHAGHCPECEQLLAELRAIVAGLGRLGAPGDRVDTVRLAAAVRQRLTDPPAS